jgi:hypothetical protein
MKKLALKLDDLQVDTFGTMPDATKRQGTVHANGCNDTADVYNCTGVWSSCHTNDTYFDCPFSGMNSCGETCGCSGDETCAPACPLSYWTDCHRC